jgi:hypothetical protein
METTPEGAAVVRVSDGHVLGHTNDTIEFHQATEPVTIRFELEGYIPVTRVVSAASDGEVKVELKPIQNKRTSAGKKTQGSKAQK